MKFSSTLRSNFGELLRRGGREATVVRKYIGPLPESYVIGFRAWQALGETFPVSGGACG